MMNHMEKMTDLLKEKDILNALQNMVDSCESHLLPLVIFRKRVFPMTKFNFCTLTHFVMKRKEKVFALYLYLFFPLYFLGFFKGLIHTHSLHSNHEMNIHTTQL